MHSSQAPRAVDAALVEVQRASGGFTEHLHTFNVVINDKVVGWLGAGASETFAVAPGCHEIFVEVLWCRSERVEVQVHSGQKVNFRCETRASFFTDPYWATLGRRRYLRLTEVSVEDVPIRSPRTGAGESIPSRRPTEVASGKGIVGGEAGVAAASSSRHRASRQRQPYIAGLLMIAVGILAFAMTRGVEFLAAISVTAIGVQAAIALNYHLLAPRSASRAGAKSIAPFRFRIIEQGTISAALALAGLAGLVGILPVSTLAGWLAMFAAAAGAANIVATRQGNAGWLRQAS